MNEDNLVKIGISPDEARVYMVLLTTPNIPASSIAKRAHISSRPLVYKVLQDLEAKGLCEKKDTPGAVSTFFPLHPSKFEEIAKKRETEAYQAARAVENVVEALTSQFSVLLGKPGIRYVEGEKGIKYILDDSLKAQTEILQYVDVEIVETRYKSINDAYIKSRERLGVKKKLLLLDTPFVRNLYAGVSETVSEVRLIARDQNPYPVSMQIYDNKVSYLTLIPGKEIGMIIEDVNITAMHRHLFLELYKKATPLYDPKLAAPQTTV
jgi:sugar-specific transcriptional regulator TrmB